MAGMILAKNAIVSISKSLHQSPSLFLRSSASTAHKFSRVTFTTSGSKHNEGRGDEEMMRERAKEDVEKAGERTTEMSEEAKQKATEMKDRAKESAQDMKERTKDTAGSMTDKAWGAAQDMSGKVKDKTKDMAEEKEKEKQKHWKKSPEGWHVVSTDGSVREDIAGIGRLIRDNNGFIVAAFAAGIPTAPIHVIETKAIVKGVKIAMSTEGVTNLIIN